MGNLRKQIHIRIERKCDRTPGQRTSKKKNGRVFHRPFSSRLVKDYSRFGFCGSQFIAGKFDGVARFFELPASIFFMLREGFS